MPSHRLPRSLIRANPFLSSIHSAYIPTSSCVTVKPSSLSTPVRHESSWRRQTQRLAMPIAPSMNTRKVKGPTSSHIIFNPPASSPNVYHTPLKFLPRNDKRRKLYERGPSLYNLAPSVPTPPAGFTQDITSAGSGTSPIASPGTALHANTSFPAALAPRVPATASLPPALYEPARRRSLTQEDVEEIRRLRLEDPFVWTRPKLAEKFGCSNYLVGVIQKSEEAGKATEDKLNTVRARWGPRKVKAKRDALRRKELWGRDA
jgi:hypothetical protein